jgi:hypothetical protein
MPNEYWSSHTYQQSRFLYVVLQGEFALYHQKLHGSASDRLWIMAPLVDQHVYKAGPWLTDWYNAPELPYGHRLHLRNVHGEISSDKGHLSRAIPEQCSDIFLKLGRETLTPQAARVVITAPTPLAILAGRLESTPSVVITVMDDYGNPTFPPVPPNPTVIPILVYKWFDGKRPDLWDEDAQCVVAHSGGPSDQFQSMQIYATGLNKEEPDHAKTAFQEAAKLLGVNASIDWIDTIPFPSEPSTPPPGLSWAQINLFLYQIVGLSPDELASDHPVARSAELLASIDSGNCGPTTG